LEPERKVERMKQGANENGSVLVLALFVLLMASITSILMVTTSTLETRIAGNDKTYTTAFYVADGGIAPGTKVLLDTFTNKMVASYPGLKWTADTAPDSFTNLLLEEILGFGTSESGRGFSYSTPGGGASSTEVRLQRERTTMLSSGSSAEFGAGYEGAGYGSNAGVQFLYFVRSTSSGPSDSTVRVETKYLKVLNVGEE
jgi:Tfp pilus assembly protein PilX